jgi:VanZ family protein
MVSVAAGSLAPASASWLAVFDRLGISDKTPHFGAYALLSVLAALGFQSRSRGVALGLLMAVLGAALEGGQTFSPGRAVELSDLAANNLGVFCGLVLALPLR